MSTTYFLTLWLNNQAFQVNYFKGFEAISRDFQGKLTLLLKYHWENPHALLGRNASLQLEIKEELRYFNGFITSVKNSVFPNADGYYELKLKLSTWPALFRETQEYQIFENKQLLEILKILFQHNPNCRLDFSRLKKTYPELAYSVQHQESRTQFMRRLLASAKIQSVFKHEKNQHCLILIDQNPTEINQFDETHFWQWQIHHRLSQSENSYSLKSSHLNLRPNTHFRYHQKNYQIIGLKHEAHDLSHANQSSGAIETTQSYSNQSYLIASESFYTQKATTKTRVHGVQTAVIIGLNEQGVNLAYPWSSQASKQSVSALQMLADEKQNIQWSPTLGSEAVVGYENGDPERPLVLAACYNAELSPAFDPIQKSWSSGFKTPEQTELCFNDTPEAEQISLVIARDFKQTVGLEQSLKLQGNYRQSVEKNVALAAKHYLIEAPSLLLKAGESLISLSRDEIVLKSTTIHLN